MLRSKLFQIYLTVLKAKVLRNMEIGFQMKLLKLQNSKASVCREGIMSLQYTVQVDYAFPLLHITANLPPQATNSSKPL
jgi:hypothetical protein